MTTEAMGRRRADRRRARGQGIVLDWGIALALCVATVTLWASIRSGEQRDELALNIADQTTTIANAATRYLIQNYTAMEQWFSDPNAAQTIEFSPSCLGVAGCTMPAVGTPVGVAYGTANWKSLANVGLLPPSQVNVNQAGQQFDLVVHCAADTNNSCTQISAMLTMYGGGPTLSDAMNARIANAIGARAGFIPLTGPFNGIHETPDWLTNYNFWSIGGTPRATAGHIAISLDVDISREIATGQVHRFGGGDDTRPQTMERTIYMSRSSVDQSPANVCFCGSDGYFHGLCQAPGTAGIPDTPTSPNYCGAQP